MKIRVMFTMYVAVFKDYAGFAIRLMSGVGFRELWQRKSINETCYFLLDLHMLICFDHMKQTPASLSSADISSERWGTSCSQIFYSNPHFSSLTVQVLPLQTLSFEESSICNLFQLSVGAPTLIHNKLNRIHSAPDWQTAIWSWWCLCLAFLFLLFELILMDSTHLVASGQLCSLQ